MLPDDSEVDRDARAPREVQLREVLARVAVETEVLAVATLDRGEVGASIPLTTARLENSDVASRAILVPLRDA